MRDATPARSVLHLVSCVSVKARKPARAKDLYLSPWFLKARAYVEHLGVPWRILSAKHGLLDPESRISPYDETLNRMPVAARRAWAAGVLARLDAQLPPGGRVVLLAGQRYREFLLPALLDRGVEVEVPMERMTIGLQLQWLNRRLKAPSPPKAPSAP